jgi:hypothetical protein
VPPAVRIAIPLEPSAPQLAGVIVAARIPLSITAPVSRPLLSSSTRAGREAATVTDAPWPVNPTRAPAGAVTTAVRSLPPVTTETLTVPLSPRASIACWAGSSNTPATAAP